MGGYDAALSFQRRPDDCAIRAPTCQPVGDLLAALTDAEVELRITPSLVPLGRAIIQTTLHFSLIRMRNARGWADG